MWTGVEFAGRGSGTTTLVDVERAGDVVGTSVEICGLSRLDLGLSTGWGMLSGTNPQLVHSVIHWAVSSFSDMFSRVLIFC